MKLIKTLALMVAGLMLLMAGPAGAVQTPKQAIGQETALVVWADLDQMDEDMVKRIRELMGAAAENPLLGQLGGLPLGDIGAFTDKLTLVRNSALQAGGEGLLLALEMPGEGAWSPPMNVMVKTGDKVDTNGLAAIVRTMSEGEMDAELSELSKGWHNLAIKSTKDGKAVTQELPEADKDAYKAFDKQLGEVKKPAMSLAFRMPEKMREQLANAGQNGQAPKDPQAAMMLGMMQMLQGIDTLGVAISEDDGEIEMDIQAVFLKPEQAQQFAQMYNTLMQLAPSIIAGQLQGVKNMPDINTLTSFFSKLIMKQNGDTLKLNLDKDFFDLAKEVAPALEAMGGRARAGADL